ncbi:tryptophan-rich sensory protein [Streptomyces calidiresistens]|uniref:Tryptophan-rich sensory protein n=1 Tax=Streptomyces calidiresistens TaxID=1485586 RepID=A0A7W3XW91_9ACTN|nr:TspO/MBR family protein [Streptomyces calidiresistens]MBB0229477.1 tryptophan-rich sensory protein [Streptomyces calidiresistens]
MTTAGTPETRTGPPRWRSWPSLVVFVGLCYLVAAVGSLASAEADEVYGALDRPAWAPPSWLFGPVWTVLYGLIGVSAWLVWRRAGGSARAALVWWGVQLALNLAWTPLFFGAEEYGLALVDIVLLFGAIVVTMVLFARIHRMAAGLLVPYLLWVGYAGALNAAIWWAN